MKKIKFTTFGLLSGGMMVLVMLLVNCNKEEPIPSYIHIDKFTLTTNYNVEGTASDKILDAWIYIDDQLVGAFQMPCTVPVLYAGTHTVKVLAGIKENGISETRITYPFYETFEKSVDLVPGEILTLNPTTKYTQGADFAWIEDFDAVAHTLCNNLGSADTAMQMITTPTEIFENTGSGGVFLSTGATSYIGVSCNNYILPKAGAPVFLEINYYCNTDFNIGIVGYAGSNIETQSISITLRPTNGWNKVYVNLTTEVSSAITSTDFKIFFSMVKNPDLSTSYVYVDNIKLIN